MRQPGLVIRRARAETALLVAITVTVALSTTLLTALVAYGDEVTRAGVAAVVEETPAEARSVEVSAPAEPAEPAYALRAARVEAVAATAFAGLAPVVDQSAISGTFDILTGATAEPDPVPDDGDGRATLAVVVGYDDLPDHADLVTGEWASDPVDGAPLPVTVHAEAAATLGLAPGDELALATTVGEERLDVVVTGTYRPGDPGDTAFFGDELEVAGRVDGDFTTLGPFAATSAGHEARVPGGSLVRYRIAPDPARLDLAGIARAVEGADAVEVAIEDDSVSFTGSSARVLVESDLADLEAAVAGPARTSRSTVLVPVLLLSLLAGIAVLLSAALLAERRRGGATTMRARGTTRRQVGAWAGAETVALALPAALLGPPLAALLLAAMEAFGPLRRSGLQLSGSPEAGSWATSAAVALAFGVVLVAVAVAGAAPRSGGSRESRRSVLTRGGLDIALVVLAVLALLQLRRYGISGTAGLEGTRTDPLVAAAPAVLVLAVSVVALRALPVMAALPRTVVGARLSVSALLALWHVGRRPTRFSGPALLLVMATAVGTLSLAYTATWSGAQQDVADYAVGADVRVVASGGTGGSTLDAAERTRAYTDLPGVDAVMPATRVAQRGTESSTVLAVDAAAAPPVLAARQDLQAGMSVEQMVGPLVDGRPDLPGLRLPDDATGVRLTTALTRTDDGDGRIVGPGRVSLVLRDAEGALTSLDVGEVAPGAEPVSLDANLRPFPADAAGLAVVAVDLTATTEALPVALRVSVTDLEAVAADGSTTPLRSDTTWVSVALPGAQVSERPESQLTADDEDGFEVSGTTGFEERTGIRTTLFRTAPAGRPVLAAQPDQRSGFALPAVATRELAEREEAVVGDRLTMVGPGGELVVVLTSVVDRLPTVAPDSGAVLVDLPTLAAAGLLTSATPVQPDEWWLGTSRGVSDQVAAEAAGLDGAPSAVQDRAAVAQERLSTPLGIGLSAALGAGAACALIVAVIGFAVHGAASGRERLTEFAVLRATGFSQRQLLGVLAAEQAFLAGAGLLLGVAVGVVSSLALVAVLVAPSLVGSGGPAPDLVLPVVSVALFAGIVLTVLAAVTALLARSLRAAGLGSALRLGEDR